MQPAGKQQEEGHAGGAEHAAHGHKEIPGAVDGDEVKAGVVVIMHTQHENQGEAADKVQIQVTFFFGHCLLLEERGSLSVKKGFLARAAVKAATGRYIQSTSWAPSRAEIRETGTVRNSHLYLGAPAGTAAMSMGYIRLSGIQVSR